MNFFQKSFSVFKRDILLFVTNLITGIVVARTLGPTFLGIFMVLNLVPAYSEAFGRLKADAASIYILGKKKYHTSEIILNLNLIALITSGVIIFLVLLNFDLLYNVLFKNIEEDYELHLKVLLLHVPINFLFLNYKYLHIGQDDVKTFNTMTVIQAWSSSIILLLLLYNNFEIWSLVISSIISVFFGLLYGWAKLDKSKWNEKTKINFILCKEMIRYGFFLYLTGILIALQKQGVRAISTAFLIPSKIAFLGQAQNLSLIINKIPDAMATILYPRVSRSNDRDSILISQKSFRTSFILLLLIGACLFFVSEFLIVLLYGPEFRNTADIIKIILPGIVISGSVIPLNSYFNGAGKAKIVPAIIIFPSVLQLVLGYFLTKNYGLYGAAISSSIGHAMFGVSFCCFFVYKTDSKILNLVPRIGDFKNIINSLKNYIVK